MRPHGNHTYILTRGASLDFQLMFLLFLFQVFFFLHCHQETEFLFLYPLFESFVNKLMIVNSMRGPQEVIILDMTRYILQQNFP